MRGGAVPGAGTAAGGRRDAESREAMAVPEVREYRLRFRDAGVPTGDWTPVQRVTVSLS